METEQSRRRNRYQWFVEHRTLAGSVILLGLGVTTAFSVRSCVRENERDYFQRCQALKEALGRPLDFLNEFTLHPQTKSPGWKLHTDLAEWFGDDRIVRRTLSRPAMLLETTVCDRKRAADRQQEVIDYEASPEAGASTAKPSVSSDVGIGIVNSSSVLYRLEGDVATGSAAVFIRNRGDVNDDIDCLMESARRTAAWMSKDGRLGFETAETLAEDAGLIERLPDRPGLKEFACKKKLPVELCHRFVREINGVVEAAEQVRALLFSKVEQCKIEPQTRSWLSW